MGSAFRIGLLCGLSFLTVSVGNTLRQIGTFEPQVKIRSSPTPTVPAEKSLSTSKGLGDVDLKMPLPSKKSVVRTSTDMIDSEDGRSIKTVRTDYAPVGNYLFTEGSNYSTKDASLLKGKLRLVMYTEVTARGKPFWYTIYARKADPEDTTKKSSSANRLIVFRILDKDGDGRFETLLTDGVKVLVPNWAAD